MLPVMNGSKGPRHKARPTKKRVEWMPWEDELITSAVGDRFYVWSDEDLSRSLNRPKRDIIERRDQLKGGGHGCNCED